MSKPPSEWTVLSMLKWATEYFDKKGIKNSRFSIEWLLSHVLDIKRLDLYLIFDRPLTNEDLEVLKPLIKRRAIHEPLQYITGETDFLNVKIQVEPGVLIPRMETEQLVELILSEFGKNLQLSALDLGTGSGCIPIAIKKNRPNWDLVATDISDEALAIAKNNAVFNEIDIEFHKDDLFQSEIFSDSRFFDILISNPPYILKEEKGSLDDEVKNYEPEKALFCESTESMYGAIQDFALIHLKKGGSIFLEIHENKAQEVMQVFSSGYWMSEIKKDYDNKDRFLISKKVK